MDSNKEKNIIDAKRSILNFSTNLFDELIEKAKLFQQSQKRVIDHQLSMCNEEIATGSKFLHRGYYSPSRLQELCIDNVKRGRIVLKPNVRTKVSQRYYYCDEQMIAADSYLSDKSKLSEREYIIYDHNKIYGITFDNSNCIVGLSAEIYRNGHMSSYMYATCYIDTAHSFDLGIYGIISEHYIYHTENSCDGYIFLIHLPIDPHNDCQISRMIDYNKYQLIYDYAIKRWVRKTD